MVFHAMTFEGVLQICIFVLSALVGLSGWVVSRRFLNPATVMAAFFFLPAGIAMFRLSSLQRNDWEYETYLLLIEGLAVWLLVPGLVVVLSGRFRPSPNLAGDLQKLVVETPFVWLVRVFAVVVLVAYLAGNYLQTGLVIPLADPELAYRAHAEFPFFLRFFARANPAAAGLLFLCFYQRRSKWDLLLGILVATIPLSRVSRIDPAMTVLLLLWLNSVFPVVRITWRNVVVSAGVGVFLVLAATALGHERTNRFGVYEVKYEEAIGWTPSIKGPFSVFPTAYGYFPLSFENLDRFVGEARNRKAYGLYSMDWLLTGFVKLNWFVGIDRAKAYAGQYTPVSTGANVPTAMYPFYADFGAAGAWFPMLAYMAFWLLLYAKSRSSLTALIMCGLYTAGFGLASFQAIVAAPVLVQQLAEVALILFIARKMAVRVRFTPKGTTNRPEISTPR